MSTQFATLDVETNPATQVSNVSLKAIGFGLVGMASNCVRLRRDEGHFAFSAGAGQFFTLRLQQVIRSTDYTL
jgi:hypothetical protein